MVHLSADIGSFNCICKTHKSMKYESLFSYATLFGGKNRHEAISNVSLLETWIFTHFALGILMSLTTEFSPGCWSVRSVHNTEDMTSIIFLGKKKSKSETHTVLSVFNKGLLWFWTWTLRMRNVIHDNSYLWVVMWRGEMG